MKKISLSVDGRFLIREPRGISNFLLSALMAMDASGLYSVKVFSHKPLCKLADTRLKRCSNIEIIIAPLKGIPNISFLWFFLYLPILINRAKPDFYWGCAVIYPWGISSKIKKLSTVHDMVIHEYGQTMSLKNRLLLLLLHDYAIKKADILWAVSDYTKRMIEKKFPNRRSQYIFVGSSIDFNVFHHLSLSEKEKKTFLKKMQLNEKYLLFVGTLAPRKNLKFLLQIIPLFFKHYNDYQLVIVGGKGWGKTDIPTIINQPNYPKDKIIFTGYISNEELVMLYNSASCFVSTSLNEGFGLPQLEALACGCPVVTANNSAMTEVVSNMGVLIDGWNHQDWCNGIIKGIHTQPNIDKVEQYISSKYNWSNIITELHHDLTTTPENSVNKQSMH